MPDEDKVLPRAKHPIAEHHLKLQGESLADAQESDNMIWGLWFEGDEVVSQEDHQGEKAANVVIANFGQAPEPAACCRRIAVVLLNEVRAEGSVDELQVRDCRILTLNGHDNSSTLHHRGPLVEIRLGLRENLPPGGQKELHDHQVAVLGGEPEWGGVVASGLVDIDPGIVQQQQGALVVTILAEHVEGSGAVCLASTHLDPPISQQEGDDFQVAILASDVEGSGTSTPPQAGIHPGISQQQGDDAAMVVQARDEERGAGLVVNDVNQDPGISQQQRHDIIVAILASHV